MMKGKLSIKKVERLVRRAEEGRYPDGHGLYLQIKSATGMSWLFRYERTINGRRKEYMLGLGSLSAFDLDEARERARKVRQQLADGLDPLAGRKAARAQSALEAARMITFGAAVDGWYRDHETKWSNRKHREQIKSTIAEYCALLNPLPVRDIDTGLILRVLKQEVPAKANFPAGTLWDARHETGSRLRQRIEAVLDWATAHGLRSGDNPASLRVISKALPHRSAAVRHHASMDYCDLPAFMQELQKREAVAARALEFTILTAARTSETLGAVWSEIDLKERVWRIPAERMKAKNEHRVPLSDRAVEILQSLPREDGNEFVFIGPRRGGLSSMAMSMLLRRMGREVTTHGFRSSFRTWAAERTNYEHAVAEMALAHVVDDAVVRAYRRSDLFERRRRLLSDWMRYVTTPPRKSGEGNNVVTLKGSGR